MTNGELISLSSSLEFVKKAYESVDEEGNQNIEQKIKFTHAFIKNKSLIDSEAAPIKEAVKLTGKALEYEKARLELCNKLCLKTEQGNPVIEKGGYVFDDKDNFNKEIEKLQKKHKEGVKDREAQLKELENYLSENFEGDFDFKEVEAEDLPSNLPIGIYEAVGFMIK